MVPRLQPPSSGTVPSLCLSSVVSEEPAVKDRSPSCQAPALTSHKFIPQTSDMSIGATFPRNIDARNEETRQIREVARYSSGCLRLNRSIWGPVKR